MLRRRGNNERQAQSFLEYTMVLSAVVLILFAMNTMIKRGIQGMIKVVADEVGLQENAEQAFDEKGFLELVNTQTRTRGSKTRIEVPGLPTKRYLGYVYDDVTTANSKMVTNLGFTEEE